MFAGIFSVFMGNFRRIFVLNFPFPKFVQIWEILSGDAIYLMEGGLVKYSTSLLGGIDECHCVGIFSNLLVHVDFIHKAIIRIITLTCI